MEQTINKLKNYLLLALSIAVIFFVNRGCEQEQKIQAIQELNTSALNDTIHHFRNKLNQETAERQAFVGSYDELKKSIYTKDSLVVELQHKLDKKTQNLVVVETKTIYITQKETVKEYVDSSKGRVLDFVNNDSVWIKSHSQVFVDKKEITQHIEVFNHFSIKDSTVLHGLFKPKTTLVSIKNDNPYTTTTGLAAFVVQAPKKTKAEKIFKWIERGAIFIGGVWIGKRVL